MNQYSIVLLNRKGVGTLKVSPYCLYNPVLCLFSLSGGLSNDSKTEDIILVGLRILIDRAMFDTGVLQVIPYIIRVFM